MRVFISWSGELSRQVALALREWLPSVIQSIEPYVSDQDIEKGARWTQEIAKQLEVTNYGILCITPHNVTAPWLNFEAGALSKLIDESRVAPFLFGMTKADVTGPLVQFQSTTTEVSEILKLLHSLNEASPQPRLDAQRLDEGFRVWWPRLEANLAEIESHVGEERGTPRQVADIVAEVLELVRGQQKILSDPSQLLPRRYLRAELIKANLVDLELSAKIEAVFDLYVQLLIVMQKADLPESIKSPWYELVAAIEALYEVFWPPPR